jgi:hypothetical protein
MTVERISNRLGAAAASRPDRLVTGIIGGMPAAGPACAADAAPAPVNGSAAAGFAADAALPQPDGTDSGPTEVA